MGRVLVCEKTGLRKGTWSPDEDKRLVTCISKHGAWNWRELPKYAGLERCGKSCRLRWLNYLRPFIKRGKFTSEEDQVILDLHAKLGNKWSKIAEKLPGRTDNEIKNHWHTHLSKHIARSNNSKYKNIKREKLRNSNDFLHNYRPNDKMVSSILDSSTISPTSPQSSTGYSSCTVDDKVGIPKTQLIHETSLSSEPNQLELEKNFNTGTSVLPSLPLAYPISPLGEVIQSFFSSIGQDNDMFSSSATVRNQVTGTTPWEENMMDDGVTSSFIGNSFLPPLTPFTETFYSHALYDSNDTVTVASEVLSEESSEQTEHIFGEAFNMEYNRGELELPLEEAVFSYRLWE